MSGEFCYWCGKRCEVELTGKFNVDTGEPLFRYVCKDACKHGDHGWAYESKFFGFHTRYFCPRCGVNVSPD